MTRCPCGRDHYPSQCDFLDFSPPHGYVDEMAFWGGVQIDRERGQEPYRSVELVAFDYSDGDLFFNKLLLVEQAEALVAFIQDQIAAAKSARRSKRAIDPAKVDKWRKTEAERHERPRNNGPHSESQ